MPYHPPTLSGKRKTVEDRAEHTGTRNESNLICVELTHIPLAISLSHGPISLQRRLATICRVTHKRKNSSLFVMY